MTRKADIHSETMAAAAGGVTTFFDMPNTSPPTTSLPAWMWKMDRAKDESIVNYAFFFGATNNNAALLPDIDMEHTCGVKVFMGASTGNLLVDRDAALRDIFRSSPLPIVAHCEDSNIIDRNAKRIREQYGETADIHFHSAIRSEEACVSSTRKAINLAEETGARLHIAHISTATELQMIHDAPDNITAEACMSHLLFCEDDYPTLGARIKCNPAVKTRQDRDELRKALSDGRILTVATDHAPHLQEEKQGGCFQAASGMPLVQFSLPAMLTLANEGVLSLERVVELMCHNPARLFHIHKRGFIRPGYKADLVLLKHGKSTVTPEIIQSKCGWSPLEGFTLGWTVTKTFCNGRMVYDTPRVLPGLCGEPVIFNRP